MNCLNSAYVDGGHTYHMERRWCFLLRMQWLSSLALVRFEIRTYQVTDTEEMFSFGVYLAARIITTGFDDLGIIIFTLQSQGLSYEGVLYARLLHPSFIWRCRNVFHGMFQQHGRLDIAE